MMRPTTKITATFTFETAEQAERGRDAASNMPSNSTLSAIKLIDGLPGFVAEELEGDEISNFIDVVRFYSRPLAEQL